MAMYNYTPNAYGYYEDEEDRRRREQQEQAQQFGGIVPIKPPGVESESEPIKQTITYDPVTGEQRMKIEGSVQDLSPVNPMTPTVSMPGQQPAPAEPVREMVQPTDLVPEQAPVQQPQQLPPGVQMVNGKLQLAPTEPVAPMTQAQADMPAQMPGVMTQAQADMPAREPMTMPQLPQPGPAVQVAGPAQMPPAAPAAEPQDPIGMFTAAVGDTNKLLQIYNDKNQPAELRRMAGREASRQLAAETQQVEAERKVSTMTPAELTRETRKPSEEGSWEKRVIFGLLGMKAAADAEDVKLGVGASFKSTTLNGVPVEIKVRADGKAMEGYNAQTLEPLSKRDLVAAAANITAMKGANVGGQLYRDPVTNMSLTKVDTQQGPIYYDKAGTRVIPKGEPVPLTAGSDIATQLQITQMRRQQAFVGQTAEARIRAFNETNSERALAGMPPLTPAQMGLNANGELIGQAQPQVPALTQPPGMAGDTTAPAAPGAAPAAPAAGGTQRPPAPPSDMAPVPSATGGDLKAQRELRTQILKDSADIIKQQAGIVGDLTSTENSVKILQNEKTNFGTILQGMIPGEKAAGRLLRTPDNIRTENILDTVNKQAAINAKMLGANPTDRDLQFVTATKPNEDWPPDAVADWLRKSAAASRRTLDFAREQIRTGGRFIAETPQEQPRTPVRNTTQPTVSRW